MADRQIASRIIGSAPANGARKRDLTGAVVSLTVVIIVTATIAVLDGVVPVLSLGVLYVCAVLPVAAAYGLRYAVAVSVASMVAFNFFFLPPLHTLTLSDSGNWLALAVYLSTSVVVSELASRERRRALQAEQREREAGQLADIAAMLLGHRDVSAAVAQVSAVVESATGVRGTRLALGERSCAEPDARTIVLGGDDPVATVVVPTGAVVPKPVLEAFLPAVAALLVLAVDRERLSRDAAEADALRRSDAAKTAVLRAVSHDLRSPITAIRVAADSLTTTSFELMAIDRAELIETVGIESRRLERIVSNLLDLSRLQADAATPERELWTPDALVEQALAELGRRGDGIDVDLPADLPVIRADASHVRRALVNLLENALSASPAGARVSVQARVRPAHVELLVIDDGDGVPPADAERIFEPFQRGTVAAADGAGLGLAIVRGFAEANGGYARPEHPAGGGACFVLGLERAGDVGQ